VATDHGARLAADVGFEAPSPISAIRRSVAPHRKDAHYTGEVRTVWCGSVQVQWGEAAARVALRFAPAPGNGPVIGSPFWEWRERRSRSDPEAAIVSPTCCCDWQYIRVALAAKNPRFVNARCPVTRECRVRRRNYCAQHLYHKPMRPELSQIGGGPIALNSLLKLLGSIHICMPPNRLGVHNACRDSGAGIVPGA